MFAAESKPTGVAIPTIVAAINPLPKAKYLGEPAATTFGGQVAGWTVTGDRHRDEQRDHEDDDDGQLADYNQRVDYRDDLRGSDRDRGVGQT